MATANPLYKTLANIYNKPTDSNKYRNDVIRLKFNDYNTLYNSICKNRKGVDIMGLKEICEEMRKQSAEDYTRQINLKKVNLTKT